MSIERRNIVLGLGLALLLGAAPACKKSKARKITDDQAETPSAAAKKWVDGVSDDAIKLAQVASFTGAQAALGTEGYRGAMAWFLELNSNGGIHGRRIELVPVDDKYTAEGGEQAAEKVIADEDPFAFVVASGTEPSTGLLRTLKKHEAKKLSVWGSTSGAEVLREGELAPFAFNVRGSLQGAGRDIVEAYVAAGVKKIGIVAQDDGFGKSAGGAARKAAEEKGITIVLEAQIPKTSKPDTNNATDIVTKMRSAGAEAVILAATYNPSTVFVRDAREAGWNVPAATMATPDTMLRQLIAHEKKTGKRMTNAVLGCVNAPPVNAIELAAVREYRDLVDKRNPRLPSEIADPNYRPLRYSTNALEGFLTAKVFGEALNRAGRAITRESMRKATESIRGWDPGVGQAVSYGPGDNQGFDSVWLAGVRNDEFTLISDMKKYLTEKPQPVVVASAKDGDKEATPADVAKGKTPPAKK